MKDKKTLKTDNATIHQTNENCQVFNGPISGCVFAMPGATVNHTAVQKVTAESHNEKEGRDDIEGEPLSNHIFDDQILNSNERLVKLRQTIAEAIGQGNADKIDLEHANEWYWLYAALLDAGLLETRRNRENAVTDVGFVKQMALWFPHVLDINDEKKIRQICKGLSTERTKWTMNGKQINLVDIEANKRRLTAMRETKISRIVSVVYQGVYVPLAKLKAKWNVEQS